MPTRHRRSDRPDPVSGSPSREGRAGARLAAHVRRSPGWYQRLAARLDEIEAHAVDEPEPVASPILSALRRLCIACGDCSAEAERHDRARDAALSCERDLQRDMSLLLDTLTHTEPSSIPLPELGALAGAIEGASRPAPGRGPAQPRAVATPQPAFAIHCLGPFQAYLDDQLVGEWPGHKAMSVFKYLVLNRRHRVPKDVVYEIFWPNTDPEACRRNLHQAIYSLRHTIRRQRPEIRSVLFEEDCYFLNPDLEIWVDAEEFAGHADAARRLEAAERLDEAMVEYGRAEALYRGHLLEESLYEDWVGVERERLRDTYTHIARRLAIGYIERQEYSAAIGLCQKELMLDRCDEDAHRTLMQCYEAQGQRHLALRQLRACAEALRADFNLAPSAETIALGDVLRRGS
jgi:DNA-binding SARP family transcriptional activator